MFFIRCKSTHLRDRVSNLSAKLLICVSILLSIGSTLFGQELPNEIRGYKIYREKITVSTKNASGDQSGEAFVKIGEAKIADLGLTGLTFELPAEITSSKQSGKVDFLTFKDVRVNGIVVDVAEYAHAFEFKKGDSIALPKPAVIYLSLTGIAEAAWKEIKDSKAEWTVSGRVFVFGRFRRFGFYHKRVIPVDFEVRIANPLKNSPSTKPTRTTT